jgi:hypothetical protein
MKCFSTKFFEVPRECYGGYCYRMHPSVSILQEIIMIERHRQSGKLTIEFLL